jgi:hypothetical protein
MTRAAQLLRNPRFKPQQITLYRPTFGTMTNGIQSETFAAGVSVQAICQPAGGDDLALLPEGQRLNNIQAIWSTTQLYVANGKDRDADVLEFGGIRHTVIKLFNRDRFGFFKVLAEGFVHG